MSDRPLHASTSDESVEAPAPLHTDAEACERSRAADWRREPSIPMQDVPPSETTPESVVPDERSRNTERVARIRTLFRDVFQPDNQTRFVALLAALGLLVMLGTALGSLLWWALHWEMLATHATKNTLPAETRSAMLIYLAGGAVAVPATTTLWRALRGGSVENLWRVARRLSPLAVAGFIPLIYNRLLWTSKDIPGLLLILCAGLLFERAVRASLSAGPCILPSRWQTTCRRQWTRLAELRLLPLLVVVGVSLAYVCFFSLYSTRIYYRLGSRAFDLGIENNLLWNASTFSAPLFKSSPLGGPDAVHTGYHQTFFSYVLAVPYKLWPDPRALLIFQSTIMGAAAIPLFLWLRRRLDAWTSALVSIGYLFYPPLHGANLYDFHYQPLGPFFIWTALLFLERGKWLLGILFVLLTWSLREDMSLMLVIMGGFLIFSKQQPLAGVILGVTAAATFVLQKLIVMPKFLNGGEAFIHQYAGLLAPGDRGFGGVIKTTILNPAFTLNSLLEAEKLAYALQIFVPLLLLPLRRAMGFWFCLPGFFFTLLATQYAPLISIGFQYTTYWSMFVFLAIGWTLSAMPVRSRRAAAAGFALAMSATSWEYGAWIHSDGARGSWDLHNFRLSEEDHNRHQQAYELIEMIPKDARVSASEFINPHVSSRANAYSLRGSLYDAEYLLLHVAAMGPREKQLVRPAIERKEFGLIARRDRFLLLKRGADAKQNAEILPMLK